MAILSPASLLFVVLVVGKQSSKSDENDANQKNNRWTAREVFQQRTANNTSQVDNKN
jgi:hypothetical protein